MKIFPFLLLVLLSSCIVEPNEEPPLEYPLIAYIGLEDNETPLYLMDFNGNHKTRITEYSALLPIFSPSGDKILYFQEIDNSGSVKLYDINLETSAQISNEYDFDHSFSPDGSLITYISHSDSVNEIYIMNSDGSNKIRLINNDHPRIRTPIIDQNNEKIAYEATDYDLSFSEYWIMNINGSNKTKISDIDSSIRNHQFYASSTKLIYSIYNRHIFTINIDGTDINQITTDGNNDYFKLSPDETFLVISSIRENKRTLYTIDINGENLLKLTDNDYIDVEPCFTIDGENIVYTSLCENIIGDIFTIGVDGTDLRRLTNDGGMMPTVQPY